MLIAIFAPLLTKLFGVELHQGNPVTELDQFNFPKYGPPDHGFTWKAPLGIAPNTADDLTAEWFYGARTSLFVATVSTVVATLIGVVVGLLAGFSRGWLDRVINFFIDVFLSLPFILVALAVAPILVGRFGQQPGKLVFWQFAVAADRAVAVRLDDPGPPRARRGPVAARARVRDGRPGDRGADAPHPVQGAAAQPDRADHRVDLARACRPS